MKKPFLVISLFLILASFSLLFAACGVFNDGTTTHYATFYVDGTQYAKVALDSTFALPAAPTKDGFTFDGWYTDASFTVAFESNKLLLSDTARDLSIYAKFTQNATQDEPSINDDNAKINPDTPSDETIHYVIFYVNGSRYAKVAIDSTFALPTPPSIDGYTFDAWYVDLQAGVLFDITRYGTAILTEDIVVFAKFSPIQSDQPTNPNDDQTINGKDPTDPNIGNDPNKDPINPDTGNRPSDDGGTTIDGNGENGITNPDTEDPTHNEDDPSGNDSTNPDSGNNPNDPTDPGTEPNLEPDTPLAEPVHYAYFYVDGEEYAKIATGETFALPATPKKQGYDFLGWYNDPEYKERSDLDDFSEKTQSDITVYAKLASFNITFYVEEEPYATVRFDADFALPAEPEAEGYRFVGWFDDPIAGELLAWLSYLEEENFLDYREEIFGDATTLSVYARFKTWFSSAQIEHMQEDIENFLNDWAIRNATDELVNQSAVLKADLVANKNRFRLWTEDTVYPVSFKVTYANGTYSVTASYDQGALTIEFTFDAKTLSYPQWAGGHNKTSDYEYLDDNLATIDVVDEIVVALAKAMAKGIDSDLIGMNGTFDAEIAGKKCRLALKGNVDWGDLTHEFGFVFLDEEEKELLGLYYSYDSDGYKFYWQYPITDEHGNPDVIRKTIQLDTTDPILLGINEWFIPFLIPSFAGKLHLDQDGDPTFIDQYGEECEIDGLSSMLYALEMPSTTHGIIRYIIPGIIQLLTKAYKQESSDGTEVRYLLDVNLAEALWRIYDIMTMLISVDEDPFKEIGLDLATMHGLFGHFSISTHLVNGELADIEVSLNTPDDHTFYFTENEGVYAKKIDLPTIAVAFTVSDFADLSDDPVENVIPEDVLLSSETVDPFRGNLDEKVIAAFDAVNTNPITEDNEDHTIISFTNYSQFNKASASLGETVNTSVAEYRFDENGFYYASYTLSEDSTVSEKSEMYYEKDQEDWFVYVADPNDSTVWRIGAVTESYINLFSQMGTKQLEALFHSENYTNGDDCYKYVGPTVVISEEQGSRIIMEVEGLFLTDNGIEIRGTAGPEMTEEQKSQLIEAGLGNVFIPCCYCIYDVGSTEITFPNVINSEYKDGYRAAQAQQN